MATYSYDDNGNMVVHSRFSRRGAVDLTYIFPDDKDTTGKLIDNTTKCNLQDTYNVRSNSILARKVFTTFLMKVLDSVCNGDVFMMPGKTGAHICVKPISPYKTKQARQKGFFKEIDIAKSNLKIPYIAYDFGPKSLRKDRQLSLPKRMIKQLFRNAENRSIPWTSIRKTKKYDNKDR